MASDDEIRTVTLTIGQWRDVISALQFGHWETLDFYEVAGSLRCDIESQVHCNHAT